MKRTYTTKFPNGSTLIKKRRLNLKIEQQYKQVWSENQNLRSKLSELRIEQTDLNQELEELQQLLQKQEQKKRSQTHKHIQKKKEKKKFTEVFDNGDILFGDDSNPLKLKEMFYNSFVNPKNNHENSNSNSNDNNNRDNQEIKKTRFIRENRRSDFKCHPLSIGNDSQSPLKKHFQKILQRKKVSLEARSLLNALSSIDTILQKQQNKILNWPKLLKNCTKKQDLTHLVSQLLPLLNNSNKLNLEMYHYETHSSQQKLIEKNAFLKKIDQNQVQYKEMNTNNFVRMERENLK
ncbi:hypothetical protein M0813_02082 [Anaeramoeba flamelloides]|uniref:Uncharacterized protein n=1 Tax=Anaeramoeba flamelloides TaxID=1746091 RepID=A0ABQ8YQE4_9EUKA|nr:hypothetical protein M0813_02082 [Anaeramoeba flamelloides]